LSLAIRLFSNMVAGHVLLKILISFIWVNFLLDGLSCNEIQAIITDIILFFVTLLEIMVSVFQAYVFLLLIAVYTDDILNFHV
jgi:F0F1-type ATP synthase membrane subunit a